ELKGPYDENSGKGDQGRHQHVKEAEASTDDLPMVKARWGAAQTTPGHDGTAKEKVKGPCDDDSGKGDQGRLQHNNEAEDRLNDLPKVQARRGGAQTTPELDNAEKEKEPEPDGEDSCKGDQGRHQHIDEAEVSTNDLPTVQRKHSYAKQNAQHEHDAGSGGPWAAVAALLLLAFSLAAVTRPGERGWQVADRAAGPAPDVYLRDGAAATRAIAADAVLEVRALQAFLADLDNGDSRGRGRALSQLS
ncbi:unnamed protein product, partial [Prorocentrum cordatum]